jgi:GNAT superfamily N-acetyltransferase
MKFKRLKIPSDKATSYLKNDNELSQYWEQLNRDCYGEIIIDSDTLDHIGHVFVWHTKKNKGFIFNLEVKPQYRRQGYGWILLDDAVKKYDGIDLLVDKDNIPAIKLYEKYGFETIKTVNGQLWMKLNQIKQEGVIMFFDRLGNSVTGEPKIVEEPVVESYYDPNRPVRPGFEKPQPIQEGLLDKFKRKICQTLEELEESSGITLDKDFKKYYENRPDGVSFLYDPSLCSDKYSQDHYDDIMNNTWNMMSYDELLKNNSEYVELNDNCVVFAESNGDTDCLWIATDKSKNYEPGSILMTNTIDTEDPWYNTGLFAKSFKDFLKNANIGKDIKEYSEMDIDEMSDYIQEGIIGWVKRDMRRQTIENYFHIPSLYWNILCYDDDNKNGKKNFPSISDYNGTKLDSKYSIKKMYDMSELEESCKKIGKESKLYPIGTLKPSGYICMGKADETLYILDDKYEKKISSFNSFLTNTRTDKEISNFKPGSLENVEKSFNVEFDESFKSVFNKLMKTKPEAFVDSGHCYFIKYTSKYQSDYDKKHGNPSIREFGYKLLDPKMLVDNWGDDYCDGDGCVCFAYGHPVTHCEDILLWVATKSCKSYKPGTIIESFNPPSNAYSNAKEIAPNLQTLIKKSKWLTDLEVDNMIEDDLGIGESFEEPFTEEEYQMFLEAKINAAERNELDDDDFGLVYTDEDGKKVRKYPLTDENHIRQAVRFFSHCPDEHKPHLARKILKKANEHDMDTSNWETIHEWAKK